MHTAFNRSNNTGGLADLLLAGDDHPKFGLLAMHALLGATSYLWRARRLVMSGEQPRGERAESGHELIELVRLEALVRLRRKGVGQRLDTLLDGATLFVQPTVITDEATIAHPVDHGRELRRRKVVDASEARRWHPHVEDEEDVSLEATNTLDHQGRDVPVSTVLSQQRSGMEETGHDVLRDRDRAKRGVHRPAR